MATAAAGELVTVESDSRASSRSIPVHHDAPEIVIQIRTAALSTASEQAVVGQTWRRLTRLAPARLSTHR